MSQPRLRSVEQVVASVRTVEGGGFVVRRPFPRLGLDRVDPFLLLDEMGPVQHGPGEAKGAPDHPHRGFETVTYLMDGQLRHKDSRGNSGRLGPGDVQWMTAGSGVVHSEMPDEELLARGGRVHGFQLWVNLPRRDKMMAPRYQDVPATRIPQVQAEGVTVRVIAGESLGARAVIDTRTPIMYLHLSLEPGARFIQPVPSDFNAFAYVFEGEVATAGQTAGSGDLAIFGREGEAVELQNRSSAPAQLLLIGGQPLAEPVARYGPFVMNTPDEIQQAFLDFRAGRMGAIDF
jgi:quercetin 2,3-dioxygenase